MQECGQSADEVFDVVDANDNVVGRATRGEVHARGLLHRAANIFVFNTRGELMLQMRSRHKDQYPNCWTSSASGHVDAGETYQIAAVRELEEELGLCTPLEYLTTLPAGPQTANEFSALFRTTTDEPPALNRDEIDSVMFAAPNVITGMIRSEPERFTPPFRELFAWYLANADA